MPAPRVSVIIPYFNAGEFIEGALASIRRQSWEPIEIILVDDGSTDDIARRMPQLGEDIIFLRQANRGPGAARNLGLTHATGDIIAFLDADDRWPEGKLALQVARLESDPELDIVTGHVQYVSLAGARSMRPAEQEGRTHVQLGASLVRRRVFDRLGGFLDSSHFHEDRDWYMRVRENQVKMLIMREVTLIYQLHAGNLTNHLNLDDMTNTLNGTEDSQRQFLEMLKRSMDRRREKNGDAKDLPPTSLYYDAPQTAATRYLFELLRLFAGAPVTERYFRIGDETICLRIAGAPLVEALARAFAHREVPPCPQPSLTLLCVDDQSVNGMFPAPPPLLRAARFEEGGDDALRIAYRSYLEVLNLYDPGQRLGVYWVQDARTLPYWERSLPLRELLHWWSRPLPMQMVHAAAVGNDRGAVLLAGRGGSGKSTSALACLDSRLDYLGDDYVMVSAVPAPYAYSVYSSGKLNSDSLGMVPHLAGKVSNPARQGDEKALIFLHEHYAHKLRHGLPIRAILLPRVTPQRHTRLRPATRAEGMLALAPTTIIQVKGDSQHALDKMHALAQVLPHYWLELGSEVGQVPEVIADFLEAQ